MLLELRIVQLGLVADLVLRLEPGFTVLTGETGAGKSMIAGAMGLLAGKAVPKEMVRRGEETGWVEGVFDLLDRPAARELASSLGLQLGEDGILVLRREIRREGRNRVLINGQTSSLPVLERIGGALLSVQSQDQQRELERDGYARDILDRALGLESLRGTCTERWRIWREAERSLAEAEAELASLRDQQDIWRYQFDELSAAGLEEGEEEELGDRLRQLQNLESLRAAAAAAASALEGADDSAVGLLGRAASLLQPAAADSRRLESVLEHLRNAEAEAEDASRELERFLDGLGDDAGDLDALQSRKALYEELRRKYRRDVPELVSYCEVLGERLRRHADADDELARKSAARGKAVAAYAETAAELHAARRHGAGSLARRAESILQPLAMPDLALEFSVYLSENPESAVIIDDTLAEASAHGADHVELLVRTNTGEDLAPVGRIASGGERSRIHLGLTVLSTADDERPMMLFDEIDAGLGMDRAAPVARLMSRLAARTQVLCITHLPTVAVHGRQHWVAEKHVQAGRTRLGLRTVQGEARITEIARLLGGEAAAGRDESAQTAYARGLLQDAGEIVSEASGQGIAG